MLPLKANFDSDYQHFFYESIEEYVNRPRTKLKLSKLNKAINRYFYPNVSSFKDLVLASPSLIDRIVNQFNSKPEYIRNLISKTLDFITLFNAFTGDNLALNTNGELLNSKYHYDKIEFENCPYCNEGKIVTWKSRNNQMKRSYDWDHFFPKKHYPFLAISLFNLVPSCKVCNFLKLDSKSPGLNPHDKYSIDELVNFSIRARDLKYFESTDDFEINKFIKQTSQGQKLENLLDTIHLEERYSECKQMLKFMFRKHRSYSNLFMHVLYTSYGLTYSKENFFEIFFNVYTKENEYKQMPYSKLISDTLYKKNTH